MLTHKKNEPLMMEKKFKDPEFNHFFRVEIDELYTLLCENKISFHDFSIYSSPVWRSLYLISENNKNENSGCVYIIESGKDEIKVGRSTNPQVRIRVIETQGNMKIKRHFISDPYPFYRDLETSFHREYKKTRGIGEWFSLDFDEAVSFMKNNIKEKLPPCKQMENNE